MVDKSKRKKGTISEEDVSSILHRYSVNTVLALMQEVAQVAAEKIDWQELVKNTATGITSARELQMLWRHIAYGETLSDQVEPDAEPMDDDSDLEFELEAVPPVSREASAEAAACVKVMIASGHPNDSRLPNNSTIEAPLTINIPNIKTSVAPSDSTHLANTVQGTNICIPVYVQKQLLSSGISGEKRPNNGASGDNMPPRRKRRGWSMEEDMKLTAAVQRYGESNWAQIASGDFKNDRRAAELSQRWANLRKKQGNAKVGTSSQPSETQLAAAHRAMSLALDMPMGENLKGSHSNSVGIKLQHQSQKATASPLDQQLGRAMPSNSMLPMKRPLTNPSPSPGSVLKAAAVAAGARIATSADASSIIEAARSQPVVHMTTGGSSSMKSSTAGITNQLPSNVHFIRNGLAKAPISTFSSSKPNISRPAGESQQAQGHSVKPATSAAQPKPTVTFPMPNVTSGVENAKVSTLSAALPKTTEDVVASTSANETKQLVQGDQGAEQVPDNQSEEVEKHQTSASGKTMKESPQENPVSQTQDGQVDLPCPQVQDKGEKSPYNQPSKEETHENSSANEA